jgi:DMSO/TMAO reductase YedYZ molybdopterin-dependent catalytic subunit
MSASDPAHTSQLPEQLHQALRSVRALLTHTRPAIGSALIAAALSVIAAYAVRAVLGVPTPAETFGDRLTLLIPLPVFSRLLAFFGTSAKHWYLAGVTVAQTLLTAAIGALYWGARSTRANRPATASAGVRSASVRPRPADVLVLVLLLYLLSAGVLAPLLGAGLLGSSFPGGVTATLASEVPASAVFALSFVALLRNVAPGAPGAPAAPGAPGAPVAADATTAAPTRAGRRRFLREGGIALALLAGGVLTWEALANGLGAALGIGTTRQSPLSLGSQPSRIVPPPVPTYGDWSPVAGQTAEVTRAADFYYVSKNLVGDPAVDAATWQLQITGLVNTPLTLSYHDLQALPQMERYHTLECISNDVGGNLMSNGRFTGTSLADLLNRAGIRQGADQLIFRAADGYSDRLHLGQALDPRSLIVYLLDGDPLPQAHGYPARLLIAGLYGMKNGKWLTSLEVATGDYTGYWEDRGWTREAVVKMTSRIDVPHDGDLLVARPTSIAGVAYAADKGIARVDVTTDDGQTWQAASLRRPLGALTWVLWDYQWTPTSGQHVLAVRAVDLEGNVQTAAQAPTLPDGASGYDTVSVVVR